MSRVVSQSIQLPVPMVKLISGEVTVPMLLGSKLLGSSHVTVQNHLDMQVARKINGIT